MGFDEGAARGFALSAPLGSLAGGSKFLGTKGKSMAPKLATYEKLK